MIIEVTVPAAGESVTEATLAKWFVEVGDYVNMDDPICELETDKASMELPAEKGGIITELLVEEEDDVLVGAIIAKIDTSAEKPADAPAAPVKEEAPKAEAPKAAAPTKEEAPKANHATGHPSPAAAKILAEKNIAPAQVTGTGKDGRITKQDALMAEVQQMGIPTPKAAFSREERVEKMSRLRRTIANHLVHAKNTTAMLTTFNELNMQPLMDLRNKYKSQFEKHHDGTRLGFMGFFTKAVTHALAQVPAVNGIIQDESIVYHDYADISIAVSTPKGLVTPVVRNAESLTVAEIENEIRRLALLGRDGKLGLDDLQGGTFTITNGGVFGSMMSTPIINAPQSAILGMHNIVDRPVAENGQVVIRPMMYLALSYDHRIIDGKESVTFLVKVKEMLENPERLLLGKDPVEAMLFL